MWVYPGAPHSRFEHSLGVMERAARGDDIITQNDKVTHRIRNQLPALENKEERPYWRQVIRLAELSDDVGHLPFLHATEGEHSRLRGVTMRR